MSDDTYKLLEHRLNECHEFPCAYTFKFIVPRGQIEEVEGLLAGKPYTCRESNTGKYVSYTAEVPVEDSAEIISLYKAAAEIKGLIAL